MITAKTAFEQTVDKSSQIFDDTINDIEKIIMMAAKNSVFEVHHYFPARSFTVEKTLLPSIIKHLKYYGYSAKYKNDILHITWDRPGRC